MIKLRVFLFVAALILMVPTSAQAGWLDFLFPTVDNGPRPEETLRAPFADTDAVVDNLDAEGEAQSDAPLDERHRPNSVIVMWVQQTIPGLLSYVPSTFEDDYRTKMVNLTKVAIDEYNDFLREANYLTTIKAGKYDISGFLMEHPVLLNEGAVDGRYRWVYQVKSQITFKEMGKDAYSKTNAADTFSVEYVLTFQIGRVPEADNEHSILIETWSAKKVN